MFVKCFERWRRRGERGGNFLFSQVPSYGVETNAGGGIPVGVESPVGKRRSVVQITGGRKRSNSHY